MSHRTIIDNWNRFANCSDIQDGVDNSDMVNAISMPNEQHGISNINNIDLRGGYEFSGRLVPGLDKDDPSGKDECAGWFLSRCIFVAPMSVGIDTAKPGCDYSARAILSGSDLDNLAAGNDVIVKRIAHTGWLVLQSMQRHDGSRFIAPTFCETKPEAELYASAFDNVVAIMPIEWEE